MENALEITGLCKQYAGFALQDVGFTLPRGSVMGFIGENGAGKTTTIKAILNLIRPDSGDIRVLGLDNRKDERAFKERIGVVLEDGSFLNTLNACHVDTLLGKAYQNWHSDQFFGFMKRFHIDEKKPIKDYSKGMRMKVAIASALSHDAELLIMDEPTSGLDPIVRDEVLDVFYDFMQDERHAILLSSHITSDLDKIADFITFIHNGQIALSEPRDELLDTYGVLRCTADQMAALSPEAVRAKRAGAFGCEALVRRGQVPANWPVETVNIEQIMLFLTRGETF
ncbi:ABC transporter ATP-binding protein [Butyricicoccus faecihominis]|uniref:ABC transporter ATP-binding protein n=1 Tax=Butyricicoccaceae TaxID=3085642 RepID=UPI00247833BC|nr:MULTISPECIES: ABC transporter ATP-binding protein [Butyricicoccaceae]MCQ5130777.1 ABC transporter ATP-binding protein [Butyricicoccus faecihominis]WNX83484.1 ABC transporter ATP-binding protein [Agathobaculum sp. NTUH-O15-33]